MDQNNDDGGGGGSGSGGGGGGAGNGGAGANGVTSAPVETGDNSQASSSAMTYANLETLTRLNTEDLTSILSSTAGGHAVGGGGVGHVSYHDDHVAGGASQDGHTGGYIVTMDAETASAADAYALAAAAGQAGGYVVAGADGGTNNNNGGGGGANDNNDASGDADVANLHTYCKQPASSQGDVADGSASASNREGGGGGGGGGVASGRAGDLLDLKTVLPGPTTRRVLLIDDGHGDLEMAKSDVEFLLRGDAAGIVLREGKRSEVWSRFGKVTFQGRKVKGYVACIYCRQVYAFGDAHSTGTSTLKKHRCPAQSLVSTGAAVSAPQQPQPPPPPSSGPSTPGGGCAATAAAANSDSPAPSESYVNFPSPSVIVSIATVRAESAPNAATVGGVVVDGAVATRCLSPHERDDLIRTAGLVVGAGAGLPAGALLPLSKTLVDLGAKHGGAMHLADDLAAVFKSPLLETLLPSLAFEFRAHFVEEARLCAAATGIGLALVVTPWTPHRSAASLTAPPPLVGVTLLMSYCVVGESGVVGLSAPTPVIRQTPLRHARLRRDADLCRHVGELVRRTLRDERLDHLRRAVVSNGGDWLAPALSGELLSAGCAAAALDGVCRRGAAEAQHHDWRDFHDAVEKIGATCQLMNWTPQLETGVQPSGAGVDLMALVLAVQAQHQQLLRLWHQQRPHDVHLCDALDRHLLAQVGDFFAAVHTTVLAKVAVLPSLAAPSAAAPTLCHVLPARSCLMALCTPRVHDLPALTALKHAVRSAAWSLWPVELAHLVACVLHPAFKHMRRLDVSDRQRAEAYSMVRHLLRHDAAAAAAAAVSQCATPPNSDAILRHTLQEGAGVKNHQGGGGGPSGAVGADLKRKHHRSGSDAEKTTTTSKRQKTAAQAQHLAAPPPPSALPSAPPFDFSDLADFNVSSEGGGGGGGGLTVGGVVDRDELDLYLEEKVLAQDLLELTNVLVYWKNRRGVFPGLSQLAFWILALPSSAAEFDAAAAAGATADAAAAGTAAADTSEAVVQRLLFQMVAQNNGGVHGGVD